MNVTITCEGQEIPVELAIGDNLTLYSVPTNYSEDGLYMAQWGAGDLEPIPACGRFTMLLHLHLMTDMGGVEPILMEKFKVEGVSYAEN